MTSIGFLSKSVEFDSEVRLITQLLLKELFHRLEWQIREMVYKEVCLPERTLVLCIHCKRLHKDEQKRERQTATANQKIHVNLFFGSVSLN